MTKEEEPRAPEPPGLLSIGDVVADRYRIDAVLGEGGMGIVYRVEHTHLHKVLALKVLLPAWSSIPEVVARFEREAVAAGRIEDAHVAAATDFGRLPSGSFFLVMEFVNGRTLREALRTGALAAPRALHIVQGIASALRAAHALGIVHRDMKPENIMLLERDGDADFVKVLDFGLAKVDDAHSSDARSSKVLTKVGSVMGTPKYMSPEQALGQTVDARSDLYSVGVIFFEMLAGSSPFEGGALTLLRQQIQADVPELPPEVAAGLDPRVAEILRRLLAKDPKARFANAAELSSAVDECLNGPPVVGAGPGQMMPSVGIVEGPLSATSKPGDAPGLRPVSGPTGLLRHATRGRVVVATLVGTFAATTLVALAVTGGGPAPATPAEATSSSPCRAVADAAPLFTQPGRAVAPAAQSAGPAPAPATSSSSSITIVRSQFTDRIERSNPVGDGAALWAVPNAIYWMDVDNPGEGTTLTLVWKLDGKEAGRQALHVGKALNWRTWGAHARRGASLVEVDVLDSYGHTLRTDSATNER